MTVGQDNFQDDPGIPGFWNALSEASSVVLLLDYDGTLAPFHEDRMAAVPAPGVVPALQAIDATRRTVMVIVSGRPVHEVRRLLPEPDLTIIGTHGYELRLPGGESFTIGINELQSALLDKAFERAHDEIGEERVERKSATVAAHFRGMSLPATLVARDAIRERWESFNDPSAVEIREFNGGLEMRALGSDKGTAVESFIQNLPDVPLTVYIGDDETDEDAFKSVNRMGGHSIRVGERSQQTAAIGNLESSAAVVRFLERWGTVRGKP